MVVANQNYHKPMTVFFFFDHTKSQFISQIISRCGVRCSINPSSHLRALGDIMFLTRCALKNKLRKQNVRWLQTYKSGYKKICGYSKADVYGEKKLPKNFHGKNSRKKRSRRRSGNIIRRHKKKNGNKSKGRRWQHQFVCSEIEM